MKNNLRIAIIGIGAVGLFASCTSVRKSSSNHKTVIDSTRVITAEVKYVEKIDSTRLVKSNAVTVTDTGSRIVNEIVIDLDSVYRSDYPPTESDYCPADILGGKKTGNRIRVKGIEFDLGIIRPTRITIRETIHRWNRDSTGIDVTDSATVKKDNQVHLQVTDSTTLKKQETTTTISKWKFKVPFGLQLFAIIGLVAFCLYYFRRKQTK